MHLAIGPVLGPGGLHWSRLVVLEVLHRAPWLNYTKPTHIHLPSFLELVTSLPKRSDKNAISKFNTLRMDELPVHHNHHSPDGIVSRLCPDEKDSHASNVLMIEMTHILEGMFLANISEILKCYSRTQHFLTIVANRINSYFNLSDTMIDFDCNLTRMIPMM